MDIKRFTLFMGLAFLAIGVLGFVPALVDYSPVADRDFMTHGRLLGLFPVNGVHNLVHIGFGVWALLAFRNVAQSRLFCRANAIIYGVLAIAGFIPGLNTMYGLLPIHGHDIWLHAVIAGSTAYFGFVWQRSRIGQILRH